MGIIGKILITVTCLLFSIHFFRSGRRKQEYESGVNTLEIEKRHDTKIMSYISGFIFLLPLVSCWFPEWANDHYWNLVYVGIVLFILLFLIFPTIRAEEERNEIKKRSNNDGDYKR